MSDIEARKERKQKFNDMVELLEKIYQFDKTCKIEINYDGSKFASWQIHASNLKAGDWNPSKSKI